MGVGESEEEVKCVVAVAMAMAPCRIGAIQQASKTTQNMTKIGFFCGTYCMFRLPECLLADHSVCVKPSVDIKTKVLFCYEAHVLKRKFCFDVNRRFDTN